ncbi:MAG: hypothetical protein CMQ26_05420 [Gammaproteobacteria bacterium]|nr:hypothetical protein [Gammaproteobacteria bacterium]
MPDRKLNKERRDRAVISKLSKTCKVCNKPFTWRKKWQRDWGNVLYCSERCRRSGKKKP